MELSRWWSEAQPPGQVENAQRVTSVHHSGASKLIRIDAQLTKFGVEFGGSIFGLHPRCGLVFGAFGFHPGALFAGQDDIALLVAPAQPGVFPVLEDAVPEL